MAVQDLFRAMDRYVAEEERRMGCSKCAKGKHGKCVKSGRECPGHCQHRGTKHVKKVGGFAGNSFPDDRKVAAEVVQPWHDELMATVEEAPPLRTNAVLTVHMDSLAEKVSRYTDYIETAPTDKVCGCEWIVHPEDEGKPVGSRRVKRGAEDPTCKVHTKTGLILGFFEVLGNERN